MLQQFEHFILTRFNVRTEYGAEQIGIKPDWLSHRFDLFEKFCYPSVKSQANQNFRWFVFFDSETPNLFKQKIDQYAEWKNFSPVYIDTEFTDSLCRQIVANSLRDNTKYLITTRLDNDDAISRHFIEFIQAEFCQQSLEFINLTCGYTYCDNRLYAFNYRSNPFISLIEKISGETNQLRTVYSGDHTQLSRVATIRQVKTQPAWLQVIHGNNVSNKVRGVRQPMSILKQDFQLEYDWNSASDDYLAYLIDSVLTRAKLPIETALLYMPKDVKVRAKKLLNYLK